MPEKTIAAFRESGSPEADAIFRKVANPDVVLEELAAVGVDLADVASRLEDEGIRKFTDPHEEALEAIRGIMGQKQDRGPTGAASVK